jgi:broad specificity phosphatase PhoE
VRVEPGLVECGIGECEGSTDAASQTRCVDLLRAWIVDGDLEARIPGGDSGRELSTRVTAALTAVAAAHAGRSVIVVSHVAALTVGLLALCADLRPAAVWGRPLPHATPVLVRPGRGGWSCASWPETGR